MLRIVGPLDTAHTTYWNTYVHAMVVVTMVVQCSKPPPVMRRLEQWEFQKAKHIEEQQLRTPSTEG